MKPSDRRLSLLVLTGVAWSLCACGGSASEQDAAAPSPQTEVAKRYADALNRCFASDVAARVIVRDQGATPALADPCAALPSLELRGTGPSFAAEHADLLLDPSMTGARFTSTLVSNSADGPERVDVTLRYFRSNGAPYEFRATLKLPYKGD